MRFYTRPASAPNRARDMVFCGTCLVTTLKDAIHASLYRMCRCGCGGYNRAQAYGVHSTCLNTTSCSERYHEPKPVLPRGYASDGSGGSQAWSVHAVDSAVLGSNGVAGAACAAATVMCVRIYMHVYACIYTYIYVYVCIGVYISM